MDEFAPYITLGYGSGRYGSGDDEDNDKDILEYKGNCGNLCSPLLALDEGVIEDSSDTLSNLMLATLGMDMEVNQNVMLAPSLSYMQRVEDVDVNDKNSNVDDSALFAGVEANLTFAYDFAGPIELEILAAYMFTDEGIGYEDPKDAYGVESALTMKF